METLQYSAIKEINKKDIRITIDGALSQLSIAQKTYPDVILNAFNNGFVEQQIDKTQTELATDSLSNVSSKTAGAYFINENIIGGSRTKESVDSVNALGERFVPDWKSTLIKNKLGPGVGFIESPQIYRRLIQLGIDNPNLSLNYTAPFGNAETVTGIQKIMNAKIDPEKKFFPDNGVFLTEGATEGIDLFMESMRTIKPESRIVFLGLSYYTGTYAAEQKGLKIDRLITNPVNNTGEVKFLPTAKEIAASLPADTKALVLTLPNNPNGEVYSENDLSGIITLAKEKNITVLVDTIFENLYFDENENSKSKFLQIANELNALDNVVIIDSLSKTRNIPGERIGFMATTNNSIIDALTNITMARRCNPRLTLGPVMLFEGLARTVKAMQKNTPQIALGKIIDKAIAGNPLFKKQEFESYYQSWDTWNTQALEYYKGNLQIVKAMLGTSINGWSPDQAAYNTLIRPQGIPLGTNNIDYLAKLMFTTATYTQVGPCFGLSQKVWDQNIGVWSRITYACGRNDLIEGLKRLITFSQVYAEKNLGNANKYPVLTLSYDKQI